MKNPYAKYLPDKADKKNVPWISGIKPNDFFKPIECGSGSTCRVLGVLPLTTITDLYVAPGLGRCRIAPPYKTSQYGAWPVWVSDLNEQHTDTLLSLTQNSTPIPLTTTKDKLNNIGDAFGLGVSQVAEIVVASRTSVHAWLKGQEEPTQLKFIERIDLLYKIAQQWKSMTTFHYPPDRLMRQPLGDGPSMFDRLKQEPQNKDLIQDGLVKLNQLMVLQNEQIQQLRERQSKHPVSDEEKNRSLRAITRIISSEE